jgi:hypothetical protein
MPLDRDRQDAPAAIEMRRLANRHVSTEGVDGGESDIARPRRVASVLFDMIEKRPDKRRVEIVEGQRRGGLRKPLLRKPEQQPKGIAIGRDGMGLARC